MYHDSAPPFPSGYPERFPTNTRYSHRVADSNARLGAGIELPGEKYIDLIPGDWRCLAIP